MKCPKEKNKKKNLKKGEQTGNENIHISKDAEILPVLRLLWLFLTYTETNK